jgi:hypothetical protein
VLIVAFSSIGVDDIDKPFEFRGIMTRNDCGVLLLRDPDGSWYHRLRGLAAGPEAVAKLVSRHARGYRRVICIGYSMGGYAALLIGRMIGADSILALASQTSLSPMTLQGWGDRRWDAQITRLSREGDARFLDLATFYRETQHLFPEQDVALTVCSDDLGLDLRHAGHLAAFGRVQTLGKVRLQHQALVVALREAGILREMIDQAVAGSVDPGNLAERYARWMVGSRHSLAIDPYRSRIEDGVLALAGSVAIHAAAEIACDADPSHRVRLGVRLYATGVAALRREARFDFPSPRLRAGTVHAFSTRVDVTRLPPGRYALVVALVREGRFWFDELGFKAAHLELLVDEKGTPRMVEEPPMRPVEAYA